MENNLKKTSDDHLILELKHLVTKEREVLIQVLNYLREIEARKLYLARGFPSLFAFMTEELGYSESASQRRIAAMRLIKDVPEVEPKIKKGEISLSVASQVQSFFRKEKQSRRENRQAPIPQAEKLNLIQSLSGSSARECEKKLIKLNPEVTLPKEKTRPLTPDKTLIQFTANKDLMTKLNCLKTLLSHQNPENSYENLFEKLTDLALEKLDPQQRQKRREQKANPEPKTPPSLSADRQATSEVNRYIPKPLRDYIWLRDKAQCQFKDKKTGKLCGSKQNLELDHRFPYSLGGENHEKNLALKCRAHNQYRSHLLFGKVSRHREVSQEVNS